MQTETAQDLLEAVGITIDTGGTCTSGHRLFMGGEYTGPALGTPELDAILLVAGVEWLHNRAVQTSKCDVDHLMYVAFGNYIEWESFMLFNRHPGHALARAIREVQS